MSSTFGLVANYGSSSENESDDSAILQDETVSSAVFEVSSSTKTVNYFGSETNSKQKKKSKKTEKKSELLINPLRGSKSFKAVVDASSSVFYNPFLEEQEAKNAILEKHVKLTINPKDTSEINGKKICWNYRKGRCKFGHNCKYAHDSDLITNNPQNQASCKDEINLASTLYNTQSCLAKELEQTPQDNRKRKPGLSEGLIPNKKARQMYRDILVKEKPWTKKN